MLSGRCQFFPPAAERPDVSWGGRGEEANEMERGEQESLNVSPHTMVHEQLMSKWCLCGSRLASRRSGPLCGQPFPPD